MFHRILVALDRSSSSRSVLEEAIAIAMPHLAELKLVTVLPPADMGYPDPIYLTMDGMHGVWTTEMYQSHMVSWNQQRQESEQWLQSQADYGRRQGLAVSYEQPSGEAGPCLCEEAVRWSADLIVLGRRGRSGLSELLLGSVSNYVMHHASCSVLTVQGEVAAVPPQAAGEAAEALAQSPGANRE